MDLIPISDNVLINVERIDSIEVRKVKGEKQFILIVGGKSYIPEGNVSDLMKSLITCGASKATNQFFSV